jgi:transcriptional regulator with XRE-family HTH domain
MLTGRVIGTERGFRGALGILTEGTYRSFVRSKISWRVDGARFKALRIKRRILQAQLAKRAGVSESVVRRCERGGIHGDAVVRPLAKVLETDPTAFATLVGEPVRNSGAKASLQLRGLPPPSASELLVDLERNAGIARRVDRKKRRVVTATVFQDVMTVFEAYEGHEFVVEGRVERQRGIPDVEAATIGARNGRAARFMVVCDVVPGHVLVLTVHAREFPHLLALQELHAQRGMASIVVRVAVAKRKGGTVTVKGYATDVPAGEGASAFMGYTKFVAKDPHPWTFVVHGVEPGKT